MSSIDWIVGLWFVGEYDYGQVTKKIDEGWYLVQVYKNKKAEYQKIQSIKSLSKNYVFYDSMDELLKSCLTEFM